MSTRYSPLLVMLLLSVACYAGCAGGCFGVGGGSLVWLVVMLWTPHDLSNHQPGYSTYCSIVPHRELLCSHHVCVPTLRLFLTLHCRSLNACEEEKCCN